MNARTLAGLLMLTLAAHASAGLYKYIGPDGKIVYADRPPPAPTPNVQVFSAGVPRAVGANERGYVAPHKEEAPEPAARHTPSAADNKAVIAPLLPALRTALTETTLIDRAVDLCILALPASFRRYVGAQDTWKERNAAVTERVGAILSDLVPGDDRLKLEQEALEHATERLHPVRASKPAQRIAWCDKTADEIAGGKFDLAPLPGMQALMQFEAR